MFYLRWAPCRTATNIVAARQATTPPVLRCFAALSSALRNTLCKIRSVCWFDSMSHTRVDYYKPLSLTTDSNGTDSVINCTQSVSLPVMVTVFRLCDAWILWRPCTWHAASLVVSRVQRLETSVLRKPDVAVSNVARRVYCIRHMCGLLHLHKETQ